MLAEVTNRSVAFMTDAEIKYSYVRSYTPQFNLKHLGPLFAFFISLNIANNSLTMCK